MTAKVLFIGWDGGDWAILNQLVTDGYMSTLATLKSKGIYGELQSTFPPHSVTAWTSFLSGVSPREHGIVDFRRVSGPRYFPDLPMMSDAVPSPNLLTHLSSEGSRVLSANIPMTFPPFEINGGMIAGVFLPPGVDFTYPPELMEQLNDTGGFPINGMEWSSGASLRDLFSEAVRLIERRADIFVRLLTREKWDYAQLGFMAPDRLQHAAMHLLDAQHPLRAGDRDEELVSELALVYQHLDSALRKVIDAAGADVLILASDHGFRSVWTEVIPNRLLERLGYLRYRLGRRRVRRILVPIRRGLFRGHRAPEFALRGLSMEASIDWQHTVAYCPGVTSQGIRFNVLGRDPDGIVPPDELEGRRSALMSELRAVNLRDGTPTFSRVEAAENVVGDRRQQPAFPDIVLWPGRGVSLGQEGPEPFKSSGRKTGDHRKEGIILTLGIKKTSLPRHIWDVSRTIVDLCEANSELWQERIVEALGIPAAVDKKDEAEILKHLQGLGYVE